MDGWQAGGGEDEVVDGVDDNEVLVDEVLVNEEGGEDGGIPRCLVSWFETNMAQAGWVGSCHATAIRV